MLVNQEFQALYINAMIFKTKHEFLKSNLLKTIYLNNEQRKL